MPNRASCGADAWNPAVVKANGPSSGPWLLDGGENAGGVLDSGRITDSEVFSSLVVVP